MMTVNKKSGQKRRSLTNCAESLLIQDGDLSGMFLIKEVFRSYDGKIQSG